MLFTNLGNGIFSDTGRPQGCDEIEESRGVAIADLNKDGKQDVVINNNDAAPTIYLNNIATRGSFFRCTLKGDPTASKSGLASSADALGARVELDILEKGKRRTLTRFVEAGSGYSAQSEPTLHFGLGNARIIDQIRIDWPSGRQQTIGGPYSELENREWIIEENKEPVDFVQTDGRLQKVAKLDPPSRE